MPDEEGWQRRGWSSPTSDSRPLSPRPPAPSPGPGPPYASSVYIRHLSLTGFRNYRRQELELPAGNVLFLGDNAQGKSNLLEATYLLASGKSPRAGNDGEMIGWNSENESQPFARLLGRSSERWGDVQLEMVVAGPSTTPSSTSSGGQALSCQRHRRRAVSTS